MFREVMGVRLRGMSAVVGVAVALSLAGCTVSATNASVQGRPVGPGVHRSPVQPTPAQTVAPAPTASAAAGAAPQAPAGGGGGTLHYSGIETGSETFASADCGISAGQLQYLNAPGAASGKPLVLAVLRTGQGLAVEFTPGGTGGSSYRAGLTGGVTGLAVSQSGSAWQLSLTDVAALPSSGGAGVTLQGTLTCDAG